MGKIYTDDWFIDIVGRIQSMMNGPRQTTTYFDGDGARSVLKTNKQTVHKSKNLEIGFDKSENLLRRMIVLIPSFINL